MSPDVFDSHATFESVPRYCRLPRTVLCAQLRSVGLALLAAGERVSVQRLRERGVRGSTAALIALRGELVAAGELPPEAGARVYARPVHPPGERTEDGRLRTEENSSSALSLPSSVLSSQPGVDAKPKLTRAQRLSKRLVRRYNNAVWCIFGRERARQIGAAP